MAEQVRDNGDRIKRLVRASAAVGVGMLVLTGCFRDNEPKAVEDPTAFTPSSDVTGVVVDYTKRIGDLTPERGAPTGSVTFHACGLDGEYPRYDGKASPNPGPRDMGDTSEVLLSDSATGEKILIGQQFNEAGHPQGYWISHVDVDERPHPYQTNSSNTSQNSSVQTLTNGDFAYIQGRADQILDGLEANPC